jgi:hypothetical protein
MKTKLILFVNALLILLFSVYVNASNVRLQWDMSCDSNVVKYVMYYTTNVLSTPETIIYPGGTNSCGEFDPRSTNIFFGRYSTMTEVLGRTNTICSLSNLVVGVKYYFAVSAVNHVGLESVRSREISHIISESTNSISTNRVGGLVVLSYED